MSIISWLGARRHHASPRTSHGADRPRRGSLRRLHVEPLEDRCVLSNGLSASLVADVVPGADSSNPHYLANVNGTLYFGAKDPTGGVGLWKSDGTAAGTAFIKNVGPAGAAVSNITQVDQTLFFNAFGYLWKTDGTANGTVLLALGGPGTARNGKLYFTSNDSNNGAELWVSDGTTTGTKLVKDNYPGSHWVYDGRDRYRVPFSSHPEELTNLNGTLLFAATDGTSGRELWKSDGTPKGTKLVKDIAAGVMDANPENLTIVNDVVYFTAGGGLWKTNGTTAGTVLVKEMEARDLTNVNGTLFFAGYDAAGGWELWKSDGTPGGTARVKDIVLGSSGSWPDNLTNVNGTLFFSATDGASGWELWKSNGTAASTVMVMDINVGASSSSPTQLTNVNGMLYFAANDGASGNELWQSDGTALGTAMVRDINVGSGSSDPGFMASMNNKLYFAATDAEHGRELWDPPPVEPSVDYLLVTNVEKHNVLRYDADTGAFVDEFVKRKSGDLSYVWGAVFGPHDHDLYVSSGHWFGHGKGQTKAVLHYDGTTGEFEDEFVEQGRMYLVHGITFGPDGNVYVGDKEVLTNGHQLGGRIMRFDGHTGEFIDEFVSLESGGLRHPAAHVFGPNGEGGLDLYVSNEGPANILRYDGTTGAFLGEFVSGGSGGLSLPNGVVFGPDGNLYVASFGTASVMRYQGWSGTNPGAPLPAAGNSGATFVPAGSGGLLSPTGILFGPDANGDGRQDLYVASADPTNIQGKLGNVKIYDGVTGAFLETFIAPRSGGLDDPSLMTFTQTDPVTLAYLGGGLLAAALPAQPLNETLSADQVQPLLTEAIARWQRTGANLSSLISMDLRIADLSGAMLGHEISHTIWLDDNAAGWGWFVDPTPWDDAEFTTLGNEGEGSRMDSLSVLEYEVGHLLGFEQGETGVMEETVSAGERLTMDGIDVNDEAWLISLPDLTKKHDPVSWSPRTAVSARF